VGFYRILRTLKWSLLGILFVGVFIFPLVAIPKSIEENMSNFESRIELEDFVQRKLGNMSFCNIFGSCGYTGSLLSNEAKNEGYKIYNIIVSNLTWLEENNYTAKSRAFISAFIESENKYLLIDPLLGTILSAPKL